MIFKESQTYYKAFENELNRHIKRDFSIGLPVKSDNSPDWQYIEDYNEERIKEKLGWLSPKQYRIKHMTV